MSPKQADKSDKVSHAFLLVEDARPCLCFNNEANAAAFVKQFPGAESYYIKTHVFIPKPFGLESVAGTKSGETAFIFHDRRQAEIWHTALQGYAVMYTEGVAPKRSVFLGGDGHESSGEPLWPGVA